MNRVGINGKFRRRVNGCCNAYIFTYSFQSPEFYKHLGYEVFGELEDFPLGHCRYFLKKRLTKKTHG